MQDIAQTLWFDGHDPGAPASAQAAVRAERARQGLPAQGTWATEYGPLNRIVSLWAPTHAETIADSAQPRADWLDASRYGYALRTRRALRTDLLASPLLELRMYAAQPGCCEDFVGRLLHALPYRERYSPCAGVWVTQERGWDIAVHLWAYDSLAHRMAARDASVADADWTAYRAGIRPLLKHLQAFLLVPVSIPEVAA
jgi:hypothetical protein